MPAGRPKKLISKEDIDKVRRMAEQGIPIEVMGHIFGISPRTMENRMRDQPEVREAYLTGASKAVAEILKVNFECAKNPKNVADRIFYIKTFASRFLGPIEEDEELDLGELKLAAGQ